MKKATELQVGIFIIVAIILFIVTIFTLGSERQIFADQEEFFASFTDVKGLSKGAQVRLGGITIGRVANIGFSHDMSDNMIHVTLLINENYLDRIRDDSFISIETQGLLGDRFLSISTGTSTEQLLPGSKIPSHETGDIAQVLSKAGQVVDNAAEISDSVNEFLKEFRAETMGSLTKSIKSLADISGAIEKGDGLIHRLVYSKKDGSDILKNISQASSDIKSITNQIKTGDGFLNALIYDEQGKESVAALTSAAKNLAKTAESISALADEIIEGEGLLHDIIYTKSPEGLEEILAKLNETASNLKTASEALSKGGGTIGALLIDSQLYDNLVEVTDGAKRSIILRHAIRSSLEKDKDE